MHRIQHHPFENISCATFRLKMVTNKSVKWRDTLCHVEYTHSNQEYVRKSDPSSTTPVPVSNFADIFGNQV